MINEMNKNRTMKPIVAAVLCKSLKRLALIASLSVVAVAGAHAQDAAKADEKTWPCVQAKVMNLSPTAMWDGPAIEEIKDIYRDDAVRKLVPFIVSRRVELTEVEKAIEDFAKAHPEDKRDEALTLLFAGAFDSANITRRSVVRGIERYQARQRARADQLQVKSTELTALRRDAGKSAEANKAAKQAQVKYDWDARVFEERQQNIPFACEIPVIIGQRVYALAQAIRAQMIN